LEQNDPLNIAAVVLGAGMSTRMGTPKLVLPWGDTLVIRRIVDVLHQAGVEETLIVTGGARGQVESAIEGLPVKPVFNPRFAEDHMALSLGAGLGNLPGHIRATLVVLGDQPHIQVDVVRAVIHAYQETRAALVFPSYQMKRGHPWLLDRSLWSDFIDPQPPQTMRHLINVHKDRIHYVLVNTDSIFRDLDTPADYDRERPHTPGAGEN